MNRGSKDKLPLFMPGQESWPGMNIGSFSLRNCLHFNKVTTSERILFLLHMQIIYMQNKITQTIYILSG